MACDHAGARPSCQTYTSDMTVATASAAPRQHPLRVIAADIKIAHSVFALPFALLAAVMALVGTSDAAIDWGRAVALLALVLWAMVCARSAAMLANRLLDREIDARNPRTAGRAIPSGRLSVRQAGIAWLISAAGFMGGCVAFGVFDGNWWPTWLGMPVLLWICAYGTLKRYTAWCHLYLGSSLAISPVAAALAIDPTSVATQPALWLLAGMVLCWVAGFDVIYALQDVEVDREEGLHSMPGRLGVRGALLISRLLHVGAVVCLGLAWWLDPRLSYLFAAGVFIVAGLLLFEHATVARWGTTKIALAFFTLNGVISCLLGVLGIADLLL